MTVPSAATIEKMVQPGKAQIAAIQSELTAWLSRQPCQVKDDWSPVIGLLEAAQIGTKPSPAIVAMLGKEVTRLAHRR